MCSIFPNRKTRCLLPYGQKWMQMLLDFFQLYVDHCKPIKKILNHFYHSNSKRAGPDRVKREPPSNFKTITNQTWKTTNLSSLSGVKYNYIIFILHFIWILFQASIEFKKMILKLKNQVLCIIFYCCIVAMENICGFLCHCIRSVCFNSKWRTVSY